METVSPTDAYVVVGGLHVPLGTILAVYRPSRLGDSTFAEDGPERWNGAIPLRRVDPNQLELF